MQMEITLARAVVVTLTLTVIGERQWCCLVMVLVSRVLLIGPNTDPFHLIVIAKGPIVVVVVVDMFVVVVQWALVEAWAVLLRQCLYRAAAANSISAGHQDLL